MKLLVFCGLLNIENKQALVDMFVSHNAINVNDAVASNNLQQLNDYLSVLQQGKTAAEYQDKVAIYFYRGDVELLNSTPLNSDNYHYISFYSAPEVSIASSLREQDWVSYSSAILDLHLSNMEHSCLINQADIVNHLEQIVKLFNSVSGLVLKTLTVKQQAENLLSIAQIVQSINSIKNNPQLQQLFEQLEGTTDITKADYGLSVEARLEAWLSLLLTSAKDAQQDVTQLASNIDDLQQQNSVLIEQATAGDAEKELALLQINQLQEELEKSYLNSEQVKANNQVNLEQLAQAELQQESLIRDNELSLQQISQLQEELELSFINSEQFKDDNQVSIEQLAQAERQLELLTSENELTLLQINQLQEELEQTFLHNQTLLQKIEHKNVELKQIKDEYNQKMANSISVEQSIANDNEYQEKINALELKIGNLESENELALLQINQLQEELEFYYIKFQHGGLWTPISISKNLSAPHYLENTLSLMTL